MLFRSPTPRINLDEYSLTVTDTSKVYVSGTVSIGVGQLIGVYDESDTILYNYKQLNNTNSQVSFNLQVPSRFLKEGTNTFKVKSLPMNGVINSSNPKTLTIKVNTTSKVDQVITANNISLKVNEIKNLNAKVNSGLPLIYISENPTIATVDFNGNVVGRKAGTTRVIISQSGNNSYNPTNKSITITVTDPSTTPVASKNTYTVVFNPNGGTGSTYTQKIEVGKTTSLSANKFKRDGYEFVGWATAATKQQLTGTDVTKFRNINMKHFQLGTVKYKNKASVKNLTSKNKQIVLYAVWKGNGPKAAVDWASLIAKDNNFCYNTTFKGPWGCYFCGDNKNWHNKKHYVCMTLVNAAYAHGANNKYWWSNNGTCNTIYINGNARLSKIRKCKALKEVGKPAMKNLKPGDIFVWNKKHVAMYVGKNSKGQYKYVEATSGSKPYTTIAHRNSQIRVKTLSSKIYKSVSSVFRLN